MCSMMCIIALHLTIETTSHDLFEESVTQPTTHSSHTCNAIPVKLVVTTTSPLTPSSSPSGAIKKYYNTNNCSTNGDTNGKHWSQADHHRLHRRYGPLPRRTTTVRIVRRNVEHGTTLTAVSNESGGCSSTSKGKAPVAVNYYIITREFEGAVQVLNCQFVKHWLFFGIVSFERVAGQRFVYTATDAG
ncbi:hypothetical protein BV898_16084 [Hypsibius exemplaris]|uniref:Uncharacterized protein n=1 Tax=Hypsibius exemplaris TaxID=2072580 RepID=A0A9X6NCV6_HYPEX|nr:hypothetical protein BV898_16084 [Hypsibius exemplaris]